MKRRGQSVRLDRHDEVQRKRQRRGGYFGLSLQPVIAVILYCVGGSRVLPKKFFKSIVLPSFTVLKILRGIGFNIAKGYSELTS